MKCEVCHVKGPPKGKATMIRVNKPGQMPARWRCLRCIPDFAKPDEEDMRLIHILEGRGEK